MATRRIPLRSRRLQGSDGSSPLLSEPSGSVDLSSRRWRVAGLAAVVVLAAGLAVGLYLLVSGQENEPASAAAITMPDLVGTREADAVANARAPREATALADLGQLRGRDQPWNT